MKHTKQISIIVLVCLIVIYLFLRNPKVVLNNTAEKNTTKRETTVTPTIKTVENAITGAVDASAPDWTFERYQSLMTESGREPGINEKIFSEIQNRKLEAAQIVDTYLKQRLGSADPDVERAFNEVPREYFQYQYQTNHSFADVTYENRVEKVKPWAIGWGSALSDYLGQAYMTQLIKPTSTDIVLEVGTGSGYQSSLLSRIAKKVYSIEIIKPLGEAVSKIYKPLGYDNVETRVGDGFYGWPEVKGGFDVIIVTAAAQYVPPALIEQLKPNGRMVIPVGQPFKRGQVLYFYTKDKDGRVHSRRDVGVFFIPMTGAIQKTKQ